MKRLGLLLLFCWAITLLCGGCSGSSSSSSGTSGPTALTTDTSGPVLEGTAATGVGLAGAQITVKDRRGRTVGTGAADGRGAYSIRLASEVSTPLLVSATTPTRTLYSVGEPPRVNVTPFSQLVLGQYYAAHGTTPERAFASLDASTPIPHHKAVSGIIASLTTKAFQAYGVPRRFSPIRSKFSARTATETKGDPFDQVLDHSNFTISGVTIVEPGGTEQITLKAAKARDGVAFTQTVKQAKTASATTQTLSTTQLVTTTSTSGTTLSGVVSGGPTTMGQASLQALPIPVDGALNPSATLFSSPVAVDADGAFTAQFSTAPSGPILVMITWPTGSLVSATGDQATSDAVEPNNLAGAVIPSGMLQTCVLSVADAPNSIAITPFTLMASELALSLMRGGTHPSTAIPSAYQQIGAFFGIQKIATAVPIDPTVANSASGASADAVTAGLLLAGLNLLAESGNLDPNSILMALAADASDGTFDGLDATLPGTAIFSQAPSQTVQVQLKSLPTTQVPLSATTATSSLATTTANFEGSSANLSGGTVPTLTLSTLAGSNGSIGVTPTAYVSPYTIPFTIPLSQLTYDFNTTPRNVTTQQTAVPATSWYDNMKFATGDLTWGPSPALYPPPMAIPGSPTGAALVTWQQQRVLAVAQSLIGTPYQHHHIPAWDPSDIFGWPFSPASLGRNTPGLDCSDFASFCYNYGLGIELCTGVAKQATPTTIPTTPCDGCCPDAQAYAPITVNPIPVPSPTTTNYAQVIASFQPGDLLYYGSPATHVTMWVGTTTTSAGTIGLIIDCFGNNPTVTDANGNAIPMGVRIRPWTTDTWYYKDFSGANRIITTALPTYAGQ